MALEDKIEALTKAIEANTAALKAGGGSSSGSSASTSTAAASAPASKHTRPEMQAALNEVKEKKGADAAKAIIKDKGGVAKMAEIPDAKIDDVFDAAKKALADDDM